jgi:predicted MFS family arabinose efflux permease
VTASAAIRNRRLILVVTVLGNLNFQFGLWVLYLRDLDLSLVAIGGLQAVLSVTMLATDLPLGMAADRWGYRRILVVGHLCIAGYMTTMLLAPPMGVLAIGFALMGIGIACVSGTELAVLIDTVPDDGSDDLRTRLVGRYLALVSGGLAIGTTLGAFLHAISWSAVFAACLGCEVVAIFLCVGLVPTRAGIAQHLTPRAQLIDLRAEVWRNPAVARPLVSLALFTGAVSTVVFLAQDVMQAVGTPTGEISVIYGAGTLVAVPGAVLAYRLERHLSTKRALMICVTLSAATAAVMGISMAGFVIAAFVALLALDSLVDTIGQSALSSVAPAEHIASVLSSRNLLASAVIAVGSPLVGLAGDNWGVGTAVAVFAVLLLLASLALIALMKPPSRSRGGHPEFLFPNTAKEVIPQ